MSDSNSPKKDGMVKTYLSFVDTSVLFKKPISCLFALISLLIPVQFLFQAISYGIFSSNAGGNVIAAAILVLLILLFAGVFGCLIWWNRRIIKDEGPKAYANFRRFVQTMGEWAGTLVAIIVFGCTLVMSLLLKDEFYYLGAFIAFPFLTIDLTSALLGPVIGFAIIIVTKILLFLLDPIIWLVKNIWALIVRIVLYFYRVVLKFFGLLEQNAPVWIGAIWLFSAAVLVAGIVLCFISYSMFGGAFAIALGLAMMAFLVIKRKNYDA